MLSIEDQQVPEPVLIGARKGGLDIYGPGTDGDVVVIGQITLQRDMYYNNLTVLAGAQIDTNGYRIFVKDTLYLADATSVIGRLANKSESGTVMGGALSGVKASDTLGGDGGLNVGENFFGEAEFYNFSSAIAGYKFDAVKDTIRFLMGGSGGKPGDPGAKGEDGTSPSVGSPGEAGEAGAPGNRPGFEESVGSPGGKGNSGIPGQPGLAGVGGIGGDGGQAGIGGTGGGVVIISARFISGLGIIRADGDAPTPPTDGLPGLPGTPGEPGAPGEPGTKAPDFFQQSYTYIVNYAYNVRNSFTFTNPPQPTPASWTNIYSVTTPGYDYITGYFRYRYRISASYRYRGSYAFNYTIPGNPFPTRGGNLYYIARTNYGRNPGQSVARTTRGPSRVRFRTRYTFVPGNPFSRTTYSAAYNPLTYSFNPTRYGRNPGTPYSNPPYTYFYYAPPITQTNYARNNPVTFSYTSVYNYTVYNPGFTSTNFGSFFAPQQNATEPSVYFDGGEGGAGGAGGAGAIASAGLPGQPGTPGYAGGGGVVLIATEGEVPSDIEIRAAAGTGDGGFATAGTVIIIKNEEEVV